MRVAIADDYEIVVAGITAVLEPYAERVRVVELNAPDPTDSDVDIVLRDTFCRRLGHALDHQPLQVPNGPKVVVFSWNLEPELVARALDHGAAGYLAKSLTAAEIVVALERVNAGECVQALGTGESTETDVSFELGLTPRETEVLTLVARGLTNQEIAESCVLSVNSIKSYIRSAYRKIGVSRRSQAVAWGIDNGLDPDHSRIIRAGNPGFVLGNHHR